MKKLYTFLFAVLAVCGLAKAQVTFDATVTLGSNTSASGEDKVELNGVTISTTAGGFGTGQQYRFAKSSTTTFSSTVGKITKIVFTCTADGTDKYGPGCFDAQDGYTYEGKVGTWTGSATEVTFVASSAQVRATTIAVSIDGKDPEGGDEPTPGPEPQPQGEWDSSAEAPVTVAKALELIATLDAGAKSSVDVYVKGKIASITEVSAQYGNATYAIVDEGADAELLVYRGLYLAGEKFTAEDQINVGDEVVVVGKLQNYVKDEVSTPEIATGSKLYSINGKTDGGEQPTPDVTTYTKIADIQAAAQPLGSDKVNVKYTFDHAFVLGVKSKNLYITDGERGLLLYGTNSKDLKAGDVISGTIAGELQLYNGVTEIGNATFDEVEKLIIDIVATPVKATIADISNDATKLAYESMLVTIENVNIVVEDGTVKAIDDSDNEVVLYDNYGFGLANLEFLADQTYNVTAIVGSYKGEIQLYPRTQADIDGQFQEPEPFVAEGDGSFEKAYTVADVQGLRAAGTTVEGKVWVVGYIVGSANNNKIVPADGEQQATNLVLADAADETEWENIIPVQLPAGALREALNIVANPDNLGKKVWVYGTLENYFTVAGVKSVTDFSIDGLTTIVVPTTDSAAPAAIYNLSGQRLQNVAGHGIYVIGGRKVVK